MAYIYIIENDINDKKYIGKTAFSIEKRWAEHCRDCKREHLEKRPLYRAMNKYGIQHFKIRELEFCSNTELNSFRVSDQKNSRFTLGKASTRRELGRSLYAS